MNEDPIEKSFEMGCGCVLTALAAAICAFLLLIISLCVWGASEIWKAVFS